LRRAYAPDASASINANLGTDQQDNGSVLEIEIEDVDQWLFGTVKQAAALVRLARLARLSQRAADTTAMWSTPQFSVSSMAEPSRRAERQ
jgi:hypothetical protein